MSRSSTGCLDNKLMCQWLDGCLDDPGKGMLLAHLDDCDSCAARLEKLAADAEFWRSSATSLRENRQCQTTDEPARLSPVLTALLGPTDNPYSLGRIGRFEIVGVVGVGGMGTVLKARDVDIDRIVALKLPAAQPDGIAIRPGTN